MARRHSPSLDEVVESAEALTPYEGDPVSLEDVHAEGRKRSVTLSARFNPMDIARIRAIAEREGMGATQLVRAWVLEALEVAEESTEGDEAAGELMAALEESVRAAKEAQRRARDAQSQLRRVVKGQRAAG